MAQATGSRGAMKFDVADTGDVAPAGGTSQHLPPRKLSRVFLDLARDATGPVSIEQLRDAMGDRSFAALLVLFAAINLLPLPPGTTLVLGLPLVLVSTQMVLGYKTAWLPQALLRKSIGLDRFRRSTARMAPHLERLERVVRPRRWPFHGQASADRTIGLVALVLSLAVTLPIPLGNWLPAFAVAMIGVALSERDGVLLAAGVALGIVSLLVIAAVVGAANALAGAMFGFHF